MWWARLLAVGATAGRYALSVGTKLRTAAATGSASKVFRWMWRGLNVGLIGVEVYDAYNWWSGNDAQDDSDRSSILTMIMSTVLNEEVRLALDSDVANPDKVSQAFTLAGLSLLNDGDNHPSVKGVAYIAVGQYIIDYPSSARTAFSTGDIAKYLSEEVLEILTSNRAIETADPLTSFVKSAIDVKDVQEAIEAMQLDSAPPAVLRYWDFFTYFLESLAELVTTEKDINN